jgi:hypothetical protein
MECVHEERQTQESSRRGAWEVGWVGAQRGQAARQPRKWPQGRSGQEPQEEDCRSPQCASSAPRSPQEIVQIVIASVRARFGDGAIGLGDRGIRFAGTNGEGVAHAHTA